MLVVVACGVWWWLRVMLVVVVVCDADIRSVYLLPHRHQQCIAALSVSLTGALSLCGAVRSGVVVCC